jgi:hypothetical protein
MPRQPKPSPRQAAASDTHARTLGQLGEEQAAARGKLADALRDLTLDAKP